jgi:hypothetical protein
MDGAGFQGKGGIVPPADDRRMNQMDGAGFQGKGGTVPPTNNRRMNRTER